MAKNLVEVIREQVLQGKLEVFLDEDGTIYCRDSEGNTEAVGGRAIRTLQASKLAAEMVGRMPDWMRHYDIRRAHKP